MQRGRKFETTRITGVVGRGSRPWETEAEDSLLEQQAGTHRSTLARVWLFFCTRNQGSGSVFVLTVL